MQQFVGLDIRKDVSPMDNDEFQKLLLNEIREMKGEMREVKGEVQEMKGDINSIKESQRNMEIRQDEIFQVVKALEHSNQVRKAELDSQNIRLSKVEGKQKRVAKAYNDDIEVDKVSNL